MSRAQLARFAVFVVGASAFVAVFLRWGWSVTGVALMIGVWFAFSILAAQVFRRLASADERRADLEDRVRNPPP
jgi:ABC-type siderophore export system fused ATPase/permease subunit